MDYPTQTLLRRLHPFISGVNRAAGGSRHISGMASDQGSRGRGGRRAETTLARGSASCLRLGGPGSGLTPRSS